MANGAAIALWAEVAKLLIMMAFQQMQRAGMTPAEIEKLYLQERLKFLASDPSKIPDV